MTIGLSSTIEIRRFGYTLHELFRFHPRGKSPLNRTHGAARIPARNDFPVVAEKLDADHHKSGD